MNAKTVSLTALLSSVILVGCPLCPECPECDKPVAKGSIEPATLSEQRPGGEQLPRDLTFMTDDKFHGNPNWRTWVVYPHDAVGNASLVHLNIGDAFRLQLHGPNAQLVPLTKLRESWNITAPIDLEIYPLGANETRYCGKADLPHQNPDGTTTLEEHGIRIIANSGDNDNMDVDIFVFSNERPLEEQCLSDDTHGGQAHVEN